MYAATMILASVFLIGGATALIASLTGAQWFFSASGSRAFTGRRRTAARTLYAIAGALLIAVAAMLFTSV